MVEQFGFSRRQAYRYLQEAQLLKRPVSVCAPSIPITIKVSQDVVVALRAVAATKTGANAQPTVTTAPAERKVVVFGSDEFIRDEFAQASGLTIGETVARAVLAFLAKARQRG